MIGLNIISVLFFSPSEIPVTYIGLSLLSSMVITFSLIIFWTPSFHHFFFLTVLCLSLMFLVIFLAECILSWVLCNLVFISKIILSFSSISFLNLTNTCFTSFWFWSISVFRFLIFNLNCFYTCKCLFGDILGWIWGWIFTNWQVFKFHFYFSFWSNFIWISSVIFCLFWNIYFPRLAVRVVWRQGWRFTKIIFGAVLPEFC